MLTKIIVVISQYIHNTVSKTNTILYINCSLLYILEKEREIVKSEQVSFYQSKQ